MSNIYSKAHQTMVWLGEYSDEFTVPCYHFIRLLAHCSISTELSRNLYHRKDKDTLQQKLRLAQLSDEDVASGTAAIEKLSFCPWFSRLWTFQEFIVSPVLKFYCGSQRCSGPDLIRAFFITRLLKRSTTGMYHAGSLWKYQQLHLKNRIVDLQQLLSDTSDSGYQCKIPHDRIYAVLSLMCRMSHDDCSFFAATIPVDYSLPINDLLRLTAVEILRSSRSLKLLHRYITGSPCSSSSSSSSLPSWAPNWTSTTFQFSLDDWRTNFCAAARRPYVFFSPEPGVLLIRGRVVATVEKVFDHDFTSAAEREVEYDSDHDQHEDEGYYDRFLGADSLIPEVLESLAGRLHGEGQGDEAEVVREGEGGAVGVMSETRANWLLAMTLTGGRFVDVPCAKFDPTEGPLPKLIARRRVSDLKALTKCKWRRVALLDSSDLPLGLIPDCAKIVDIVCVVEGSETPLLMRRKGNRWENCGEEYVCGIMYGEAVNWQEGEGESFMVQ